MLRSLGAYDLLSQIGSGSFGTVYRARHRLLERDDAVKILRPSDGDEEGEGRQQRFLRDARALAKVKHDNVVLVYSVDEVAGELYIAMELLGGHDLKELVKNRRRELTSRRLIDIVLQIARALQAIHEAGIVHRDIKPSNVRILDGDSVKIMDFGIAKLPGLTLTGTSQALGTIAYSSPEQLRDGRSADARSDLFSLGVVFYELLTARRPFERYVNSSLFEIMSAIQNQPPLPMLEIQGGSMAWCEAIAMRCLEKDPARRFDSCEQLARALLSRMPSGRFPDQPVHEWCNPSHSPAVEDQEAAVVTDAHVAVGAGKPVAVGEPVSAEGAAVASRAGEAGAAGAADARSPGAPRVPGWQRWLAVLARAVGAVRVAAVGRGALAVLALGMGVWLLRTIWPPPDAGGTAAVPTTVVARAQMQLARARERREMLDTAGVDEFALSARADVERIMTDETPLGSAAKNVRDEAKAQLEWSMICRERLQWLADAERLLKEADALLASGDRPTACRRAEAAEGKAIGAKAQPELKPEATALEAEAAITKQRACRPN